MCDEPLPLPNGRWTKYHFVFCDDMYAAIYGVYKDPTIKGEDGRYVKYKALGVRWRGRSSKIGFPHVGGTYRTWYVEPPYMTKAVLEALRDQSAPESELHQNAINALSDWYSSAGSPLDPRQYYLSKYNLPPTNKHTHTSK